MQGGFSMSKWPFRITLAVLVTIMVGLMYMVYQQQRPSRTFAGLRLVELQSVSEECP